MELVYLLLLIISMLIAWSIFNSFRRRLVVFDYMKAVLFTRGRYSQTLGPGMHWYNPRQSTIHFVDMRPSFETLSGQEVLSRDGVSLRVSISAACSVADALLSITASQDRRASQHLILQSALREVIGNAMIDELLTKRAELGEQVLAAAAAELAAIGVTVQTVHIRDIMFPGPLKRSFSAMVEARKAAEASLERARGEAATMRSLANTARMLDNNPNLLQLRLIQSLEQSSGNTVVLNGSAGTVLPVQSRGSSAAPGKSQVESSEVDEA